MTQSIHDKIMRSLQAAEGLYHHLVLLVGEANSGKTDILLDVAEELGTSVINVNLILSEKLLELTTKQRPRQVSEIFTQAIAKEEGSVVVLDNLEMLFDIDLRQDPLRLLQGISRAQTVLASWNGTCFNGKLMYAEPSHPEHRNLDLGGVLIVSMDGTATIDLPGPA